MATPDHSHETAPVTFRDPPVIEVALSIQFASAITNDTTTLGQFWPQIRDDYPNLEQQPALPPQSEEFGPAVPPQVEFLTQPPPPRYWFISQGGSRLVQVQPDRIILNWRRTDEERQYPRYRELRPAFEAHVRTLLGSLSEEARGSVEPNWCELTYVNHVVAESPESGRPSLSDILTFISAPELETDLAEIEDAQLVQRYVVRDPPGQEPAGRLHLTATPAVRQVDEMPLYAITFIARLRPAEPTLEGALATLDGGRELVVRAFRDLTTPPMHERWGLETG